MPSATLQPEEKAIIRNAIGHACQIYTATIVRLYLAAPPNPMQWTYTGVMGAIALMKDTQRRDAFFFRIVQLQTGKVVWEQELYRDFAYQQERPFFHTFATDTCMAGLSFADENEANAFFNKVINRENLRIQPRTNSTSSGASRSGGATPATASKTSLSSAGKSAAKDGKRRIDKSKIGTPTNFRHLTHIGWDPERGFSTVNIPPEWKKVFEKAGVTEQQLQDKQTAKFIFDFMSKHADTSAPAVTASAPSLSTPMSPPVPAAPSGTIRRPPPPPPARNTALPGGGKMGEDRAQNSKPPPPPPNRPPASALASPVSTAVSPAAGAPPAPPPPPMRAATPPMSPPSAPPQPPPMPTSFSAPSLRDLPPSSPPKKAPKAVEPPRNALLESIRGAGVGMLKKVDRTAPPPQSSAEETDASAAAASNGDIASALKMALQSRQGAMIGEEKDSDAGDEDDEW